MPAPIGKRGYRRYMKSTAWFTVRQRYRDSKLPQCCRVCGDKRVDLHHRTYSHLGHERLRDLVPLCREDHQGLHALQRQRRVSVETATALYLRGARRETTVVKRKPVRRRAKRPPGG